MASLRALSILLPLAACAGAPDGRFPSLAPRAVEGASFDEPAAPAPTAVAPDPALDTLIATQRAALADIARRFDAETARAAAGPRSAAEGSDAWLDAQVALAALDALRAEAGDALSVLEDRQIARADAAPPYPPLDAAAEEARAQVDGQAARIAELQTGDR